jgi:hypothetical protein
MSFQINATKCAMISAASLHIRANVLYLFYVTAKPHRIMDGANAAA